MQGMKLTIRWTVNEPARRLLRLAKWTGAGLLVVVPCLVLVVAGSSYSYRALEPAEPTAVAPEDASALARELGALRKENRKLKAQLDKGTVRGNYIVVDRANNRLYLRKGETVLLEAVCSAGSGIVLRDVDGDRTWTFDTPQGVFKVVSRLEQPAWRKPDWAFVEEGRPVPSRAADRIEYDMLGEYGLHFGNGYLIHGTLYERLLGRSVTHGCVRLGRDDLRKVYAASPIGTPIYIY
jgi:L,D-transpeptidase YbiS